jgi:hypothetical protein
MIDATTQGYFGLCPVCKKSDGFLNVGKSHVGICTAHQVWWPIGFNLFSSWMDETAEDWDRNEKLLGQFREVKPFILVLPHHDRPYPLTTVRQAVA